MSSPSVSLAPLTQKGQKRKKRGNFRPTSARPAGSKKETNTPSSPVEDEPVNEEVPLLNENAEMAIDDTVQEPKKTPRKRKKGVAIVGTPRPEQPQPRATTEPTHATVQEATQPIDETPRLAAFCSKFRTKRPRNAKATTTVVHEAPKETPANPAPVGPVVQIVNGEIVLQESSLVVNRAPEAPTQVVEEEAQMAAVGASYNSFVTPRPKPHHWTIPETELFFEALQQVGTDFGTMEAYFANRTRKQLKHKYQRELHRNPHLVEAALRPEAKKAIDLSVFNVTEEDVKEVAENRENAQNEESEELPEDSLGESPNEESQDEAVLETETQEEHQHVPEPPLSPDEEIIEDAIDELDELQQETIALVPTPQKKGGKRKPNFRSRRPRK